MTRIIVRQLCWAYSAGRNEARRSEGGWTWPI